MSFASTKLLLVAHASDVAPVFKALAEAGFPQPALGIGGDETLDLFERNEPDVVLLVAGLDHGDLPSLAAAIRSGNYGRPAPIILIASADQSVRSPADAGDIEFDQFVSRPFSSQELGDAIRRSSQEATGARINAAMELAIESFVADAMDSLSSGPLLDLQALDSCSGPEQVDAAPEVAPIVPSRQATEVLRDPVTTSILQPRLRESTQVLAQAPDSALEEEPLEDEPPAYQLSPASRQLLDEVLPHETLDVDLEELDGVKRAGADYDAEHEPPEAGGGDFARQLRQKMSAMAARLFPGQKPGEDTANVAVPPNSAHTEIDLRELVEGPVEDNGSATSLSAATQALVNESEITMARELRTGSGSSPNGQALVGEINNQDSDVATVLGRFWRDEFTGRVVMRRDEEEKRIEFDKGSVIFASSGTSGDRMGQLLVREGKINEEQLLHCRQLASSSGRRMGEILVDLGYLKPRELLPAVRQHLEDIFYSVFAWTAGSYDAMPEQAIEERIRLSRHPAALIMEGIGRKYDAPRLEACFGDGKTVVLVQQDQTLAAVTGATELSASENKAIGLFDGGHTVADIASSCALEPLRVAQLAHALVCLGVAEIVESSADDGAERQKARAHLFGETDLEIDRKRVLAKYMLVQEADYFQLLGVRHDASGFEIRRAYEASQRYFCAESFPLEIQEELATVLQEITEVIDEAFLVLSDDRVRNSYRANLQ